MTFDFTEKQANYIAQVLATRPYGEVAELMAEIQRQAQAQTQAQQQPQLQAVQ